MGPETHTHRAVVSDVCGFAARGSGRSGEQVVLSMWFRQTQKSPVTNPPVHHHHHHTQVTSVSAMLVEKSWEGCDRAAKLAAVVARRGKITAQLDLLT